MVQYYEVVSGAGHGGIPVKDGKSLTSKLLGRLEPGAIVSEQERLGERLRLTKISGLGPDAGWVSVRLVAKVDAAKVEGQPGLVAFRGTSLLARAEAQVEQEGAEAALAAAKFKGEQDSSALVIVAVALLTQGFASEALKAASEAMKLLQRSGNKEDEASATLVFAAAQLAHGDAKQSLDAALRALESFRSMGDRQMEASALTTVANSRLVSQEASAALVAAKEALGIFRQLGDVQGEAAAELTITDAYLARDGFEKAMRSVTDERVRHCQAKGDRKGEAQALSHLAAGHAAAGDAAEAIRVARLALEATRSLGDRTMEAAALRQVAVAQQLDDDGAEDALRTAQEAHDTSASVDDRQGQAAALLLMARTDIAMHRSERAQERIQQATSLSEQEGDRKGQGLARQLSSEMHLYRGDSEAALKDALSSLALLQGLGDKQVEVAALHTGARAHFANGGARAVDQTVALARDAAAICKVIGDARGEAVSLQMVASAKLSVPDGVLEAVMAAERARSLFLMLGDKRQQGLASHTVAQGNIQLGEVDFGLQAAMQAVVLAREAGDRWGEASALHTATHAVIRNGRYAEGLQMAREALALFKKLGSKQMQEAVANMIARIQEILPSRGPGPRTYIQPHDDARLAGSQKNIFQEQPTCVVWSAPVTQQCYIIYCLELLKLVDDLKNQTGKTSILVTTQGVMARQIGQELAANWTGLGASTVWALVRTVRLESPRLNISTVDLPPGASPNEITECLRGAQITAGPRNEIAFFIDRRNKMSVNQKQD
mmetsp:Transcript_56608/g.143285  ORF Transcript_56608/g.143285 Transcript_56608/m.143285 type:complete len:778 (-) Transcript_56608:100-2433(-)|eukprot:CAMPEP_0115214254 /NCGR_PEP_ID=MMETSP0270-20121206/24213_1 /TAXON_ID=71861 /ORGANISM="Scrippsiella trochoidea, Strain CCMP3099" /LENGTH=777 /DNA_ID=CAMNT_0002628025 /DNA_START=198 /DNA_END=2531 /DNA_ORIENTATION=+